MNNDSTKKSTASIISAQTGAVIGGQIIARHDDGCVTISFAGVRKTGMPLRIADMLQIEDGSWQGQPKLRAQRGQGGQ